MTDPSLIQHAQPYLAHHIPHAHHVAAHAAPVIKQGYNMLSALIATVISLPAGFGLGWYVKGRGMQGVQNDLNNAKAEIEKLKTQVTAGVTAATSA